MSTRSQRAGNASRKDAPTGTARRHGASSSRTVNGTDAVDDDSSSVGSRMSTRSQRAGNASRKDAPTGTDGKTTTYWDLVADQVNGLDRKPEGEQVHPAAPERGRQPVGRHGHGSNPPSGFGGH